MLPACQQEVTYPPEITITSAPLPVRIGLSDGANTIEALAEDRLPVGDGRSPVQFIIGNDQTLLIDLEKDFVDAVLLHQVPEKGNYWFTPVAVDGLVIVVDPNMPDLEISTAEVKDIFSGRITDWSLLGGPEMPIELVVREDGSGPRTLFDAWVMAGQPVFGSAILATSDENLHLTVSSQTGAIGYSMMGNSGEAKTMPLNGQYATHGTMTEQTYPLTTPLYFISTAEPQGELRLLLSWLQSDEGQSVLGEKYGRVR